MTPAVPPRVGLTHDTEVGLVNESRGLKGTAPGFVLQLGACQRTKLLVDQGQQLGRRALRALPAQTVEDSCDLGLHDDILRVVGPRPRKKGDQLVYSAHGI